MFVDEHSLKALKFSTIIMSSTASFSSSVLLLVPSLLFLKPNIFMMRPAMLPHWHRQVCVRVSHKQRFQFVKYSLLLPTCDWWQSSAHMKSQCNIMLLSLESCDFPYSDTDCLSSPAYRGWAVLLSQIHQYWLAANRHLSMLYFCWSLSLFKGTHNSCIFSWTHIADDPKVFWSGKS